MSTQTMQHAIADYFKTQPVVRAWLFGSFARGEEIGCGIRLAPILCPAIRKV